MKRTLYYILLIFLIFLSKTFFSQNNPLKKDSIALVSRTLSSFYKKNSHKGDKEIIISNEDTVISTPNYKIIIKKKNYYIGRYRNNNISDSVILNPSYRKAYRKSINQADHHK